MRLVLPGTVGSDPSPYYVRVRSSSSRSAANKATTVPTPKIDIPINSSRRLS